MKYEAHVTGREGRWWAVTIPALGEDAQTQARRLDDVADEARDYVTLTLDVAPSTIDIEVVIDDLGGVRNINERAARIRAGRAEIERIERENQAEAQALAVELAEQGIPLRDIASLTGYTFQRIGQMTASKAREQAQAS
ncbi:hypothetical protein [Nocardia cerradoensis]|uniref:Antitoxin HicB n=1 Tax=Nocardia cerradoensis TaxID=85688 RepID=A0A231HA23_9NOCA|nr:hypothetical protein [Nocardia cerradoensis]NKY48312.1 hypothetical protein [Nocardia cerradoensis]OXR45567.1 hypothetical protein B7C42_02692 [Nocardia cerradoensis]